MVVPHLNQSGVQNFPLPSSTHSNVSVRMIRLHTQIRPITELICWRYASQGLTFRSKHLKLRWQLTPSFTSSRRVTLHILGQRDRKCTQGYNDARHQVCTANFTLTVITIVHNDITFIKFYYYTLWRTCYLHAYVNLACRNFIFAHNLKFSSPRNIFYC